MNVIGIIDQAKKLTESETDSALSKYLGLSRTAVSNYRRGVSYPDTITCERLAGITGIPLAKVLGIVGEARAISREEKAVWRKLAATAALVIFACGLQIEAHANALPGTSHGARAIHYAKLKGVAAQRRPCPKRQDLPRLQQKFVGPCGASLATLDVGLGNRHSLAVPGRLVVCGGSVDRCAELLLPRASCASCKTRTKLSWRACVYRPRHAARFVLSPGMPLSRVAVAAAANDLDC